LKISQYKIPRLELRHIAVLHAIDRFGSAAEAAEQLNLTPSAITHRIREAERRLGLKLTMRFANRLRLTTVGERLAHSAERTIDEMLRAELDAERIGRGVTSILRLGMGTYSFYHWLPSFLRYLASVDHGMQIDIDGSNARQPLKLLQEGTVDIHLQPGAFTGRDITSQPLFSDELICIVSPQHHLAGREYINAADLIDETHFTYSAVAQEGFEYERFLKPQGYYPARLVTVASTEAIIELVSAGLGISILASWAVEPKLLRKELVGLRLGEDGLQLQWHLVMRNTQAENSPAAKCARILLDWVSQESTNGVTGAPVGDG
jgi:LysR family transcriptional regulator for metE and metH